MKTTPSDWLQWDIKEALPFTGGVSFHARTIKPLVITDEQGLIVGFGTGEQFVSITGEGELRFDCSSPVWIRPASRVQERLKSSEEIFTSLDRPAPLSPEMAAIQRMMRRNEMERERDRQEMERRFAYADRSVPDTGPELEKPSQEVPASEKETVGGDTEPSSADSEDVEEPETGGDVKTARNARKSRTGNKSSASDSS